jgi:hypothetical protein
MDSKKIRVGIYLERRRIHILLISILMLVFGPALMGPIPELIDPFVKLSFLLIVISCYLIIKEHKVIKYISIITFLMIIIDTFLAHDVLNYLAQVGLSFLIFYAFILVLKEAVSLKGNTENMILISITGYLIIGLVGGFGVAGLAQFYPDAYTHTLGIKLDLFNYIYYSFVTMTTLGYGDIIPVSDNSQSLSLLLVITGQLYLSIIIGINIAQFMKKKE